MIDADAISLSPYPVLERDASPASIEAARKLGNVLTHWRRGLELPSTIAAKRLSIRLPFYDLAERGRIDPFALAPSLIIELCRRIGVDPADIGLSPPAGDDTPPADLAAGTPTPAPAALSSAGLSAWVRPPVSVSLIASLVQLSLHDQAILLQPTVARLIGRQLIAHADLIDDAEGAR